MLVRINRTALDKTGRQIHYTIVNKGFIRLKRKVSEGIVHTGGGGRGIHIVSNSNDL